MSGKLYTKVRLPGFYDLAIRLGVVAGLLFAATLIVYLEGGLVDSRTGGRPGFLDCVYFALVTVTTVGYGDIVPVESHSRLIDAFLLTPIRFVVIFVFVGTAYQLSIKRFQEEYRMKRAVEKLEGHVIVCGFGATGRAAVQELLLQGRSPDQIVVLATSEVSLQEAAELGVVAIMGDATHENVLKSVAIGKAAHVLICPGRDDTAVLVALTAHDLNPEARLIAMCHEQENARLLERSGAHVIVSPSTAGGNLMAAGTRRQHLVETMQDVLSIGGELRLDERQVAPEEAGKSPADLEGLAVLRVYRGDRFYNVSELPALEAGDTIVYIAGRHEASA